MYKIISFILISTLIFSADIALSAPQTISLEQIKKYSGAASNDSMGWSVAIDGDYMVAGVFSAINLNYTAYLYHYNGQRFVKTVLLTPADHNEANGFGYSVAISGNTVIVASSDSVYVFEKPSGGWVDMNETTQLMITDTDIVEARILSLAISDATIVICAKNSDPFSSNTLASAYIFTKPDNGWENRVHDAKLSTPPEQQVGNDFGSSVAIDDNMVVVGSRAYAAENRHGSAYVFLKPDNGNGPWLSTDIAQQLEPVPATDRAWFGTSVAIANSMIAIGAMANPVDGFNGAVYVFEADPMTHIYAQKARLRASDSQLDDNFASESSLSFADDVIAVGARWRDSNDFVSGGAVYLFKKTPASEWTDSIQNRIVLSSDMYDGDAFGTSVALNGNMMIVGAPSADSWAGAAYIYSLGNKAPSMSPALMMYLLN